MVQAPVHPDRRGLVTELWRAGVPGLPEVLGQVNHARSVRGTIRGLHWQLVPEHGKLMAVLAGSILDVAVDLRAGSTTYGRWVGVELTAGEGRQLWIPPGFAHGFQVLSDVADVLYQVTAPFDLEAGRGVCWDDPDLAIRWPLAEVTLSDRDAALPRLRDVAPADLPGRSA